MKHDIIREIVEKSGLYMDSYTGLIHVEKYSDTGIDIANLIEIVVKRCGYLADVFSALGAPDDMDAASAKHSDYINRYFGVR